MGFYRGKKKEWKKIRYLIQLFSYGAHSCNPTLAPFYFSEAASYEEIQILIKIGTQMWVELTLSPFSLLYPML